MQLSVTVGSTHKLGTPITPTLLVQIDHFLRDRLVYVKDNLRETVDSCCQINEREVRGDWIRGTNPRFEWVI